MGALNKAWSDRNLVGPTDFFFFIIFFIKKIEGRGRAAYVPAFTQVRVVIMCNVVELNADSQKKTKTKMHKTATTKIILAAAGSARTDKAVEMCLFLWAVFSCACGASD